MLRLSLHFGFGFILIQVIILSLHILYTMSNTYANQQTPLHFDINLCKYIAETYFQFDYDPRIGDPSEGNQIYFMRCIQTHSFILLPRFQSITILSAAKKSSLKQTFPFHIDLNDNPVRNVIINIFIMLYLKI